MSGDGSGMTLSIRQLKLEDVGAARAVLKDGSYTNYLLDAYKQTLTRRVLHGILALTAAVSYALTGSWLVILVCDLVILGLLFLGHLICTWVYIYGPPLYDMNDVQNHYLKDPDTAFWVAELEYAMDNSANLVKEIVGTIAVVRRPNCQSKVAWLRRMAVKSTCRRMGVARHLVQEVLAFCKARDYESVYLITTPVHDAARKLYEKMGFQNVKYTQYTYFGFFKVWTYEYVFNLTS